jgi:hypothetical protein
MLFKAVYRTVMSMTPFYVENFCIWVKTAVWDAPRRVYLDIDLEKHKIKRETEHLSRVGSQLSTESE